MEGDMNENRLITYIAPYLMIHVKEFIQRMSFGFQTKGYEDFKGTNLLVSIEFIGRLTNKNSSRYRVNVDDIIETIFSTSCHSLVSFHQLRLKLTWDVAASMPSPPRACTFRSQRGYDRNLLTLFLPLMVATSRSPILVGCVTLFGIVHTLQVMCLNIVA
jgi:hypothetical protein